MDCRENRKNHTTRRHPEANRLPDLCYPPELPITGRREEIVRAISEHQVLVVTGETGSGKSTQLPKMCLEAGRGRQGIIGCTQPRRIAAVTLAGRVSEELRGDGPRLVGYKIRFQDQTVRGTRIKFMTDGVLLAEAQRDRLFRAYDTLIVDEAHERTLNIDFLLGLIKKILPRRPDLKLIVTSATIDPQKFSQGFGEAPIFEVSGRTYPVEVHYRPVEPGEEEEGEVTYVDQAVAAVDELKGGPSGRRRGDVLIFMPTESDIRETVQRLEERRYFHTLVLPLFGRMASADQQRIFKPTPEDKIVVATNVAETSITIPGIRYVVDTGLARISQYNARSRTQSLPVVSVSQASADQRKGRCGRVEAGVCIRLYSEEDYLARSPYTPPEILRSNLAEVILRMLFLRLGNIQEFPFLDPPAPAAVKDGFGVLKELGAVDEDRHLTSLGRAMAQLPLDPRLSRMLLQAHREGALRELAILAAALSVQDPRERPLEKEAQADQAQARFRDRQSDFVGLLKLWGDAWSPQPNGSPESKLPSRSRMRKFCRDHFLSQRRMREWRDVYEEICDILEELGELRMNETPASYEGIHRAVLSGYLAHVALRREKNIYHTTRNRQIMLFPGSGLFNKGGGWVVSAEQIQTSRLYARTAANIEPEWIEGLGSHLCKSTYSEPHWEKSRGQVMAYERVTLYGLTIVERRKVGYSRLFPTEAREIFIRSALVEGELPGKHGFLEHNRELIGRIQELESKARRRDLLVDDETVYQFYDSRLPALSDLRSFNRFVKDQGGDDFLCMQEDDLLRNEPDFETLERFPDSLALGGVGLPLRYVFRPGEEDDGVTVTVPVHSLPGLTPGPFEWLVPGLLLDKVTHLLKSLPKGLRRLLVPVSETAQRLADALPFGEGDFFAQLSRCVQDLTGVRVLPDQWEAGGLPSHLRMRFEVVGPDGTVLGAGRDLEALQPLCAVPHEDRLWEDARKHWERTDIVAWDFGDLPRMVELGKDSLGLVRHGYLGLDAGDGMEGSVSIGLFADPEEARSASRRGLLALYRLAFSAELKQLKKDWAFPDHMASKLFFLGDRGEANGRLGAYLMRELFDLSEPQWPDRETFHRTVARLKGCLGQCSRELLDEVLEVVREREAARARLLRFRQMAGSNGSVLRRLEALFVELDRLVPSLFPEGCRSEHVRQLPRYLKALQIRAERVYVDPEKDRSKEEQLAPFRARMEAMEREVASQPDAEALGLLDELRGMLEELKISLFAPEIKTRYRVSAKRLEDKWQEWLSWKAQNRR